MVGAGYSGKVKRTLPLILLATLISITASTSISSAKPHSPSSEKSHASSSEKSSKASSFYNDCGVEVVQFPARITQFCADAGAGVINLKWSSWGDTAVGAGIYYINGCDPTCIAGTSYKSEVQVTLSDLKKVRGKMYFMNVTVAPLPGKSFVWPPKMKPIPTKVTWVTESWRG